MNLVLRILVVGAGVWACLSPFVWLVFCNMVILALVVTAWACPLGCAPAELKVSDYQEVHEGELPIILESPHGGMMEIPITRPDPPIGGYDKYTLELTQLIRERMIARTGKSPEMVAMLVNREFIDVNRGAGTNAYHHEFTKQLYEAHYAAIDAALARVKSRHGTGLLVSIHSGWNYHVHIAIGVNHAEKWCTIPRFVERHGWDAFQGTNGVGGRLFARGYQVPGFGNAPSGGDKAGVPILTRCRKSGNIGIDGLQFEFQGRTLLADVKRRQQLANDVADTLLDFVNEYYASIPIKSNPSADPMGANVVIDAFTYEGANEDRMSKNSAKPDGTVDARFSLSLRAETNVNIRRIALTIQGTSNMMATGAPGWLIRVFQGERPINTGYVDTLGSYSGSASFDLYVNDNWCSDPGSLWTVTVMPEGGSPVRRTWTMGQK